MDSAPHPRIAPADPASVAVDSLEEHLEVVAKLRDTGVATITASADVIATAFRAGRRLFLCGNGGSAADAQHIAAEFVGRFEGERRGYPAVALTTDPSTVTAIGNDYGFERLFARQLEALAGPGDVLIAISTSGASPNVLEAAMAARRLGCRSIALTGAGGTRLAALCDCAVIVPSTRASRIQEAHVAIGHLWCQLVDIALQTP